MKISLDRKRAQFYLWVTLAYVILGVLVELSENGDHLFILLANVTWRSAYILVVNFIFFEYTLPFIRRKKNILSKIGLFLLLSWLQLMLYSFGVYAWRRLGIQLHLYVPLKTFTFTMGEISYGFPWSFFSLFFFGVIKHVYNHNKLKHLAQQLQIEKQLAELSYLKSQTNPHFLFNTLNNIYTLARDKSDLAPESILRLSGILRYMLYETGGEYIKIEEEVKIISDYIALEKLRYDDSLRVTFESTIANPNQPIPPLLLIPLVENAFKHGVSETRTRPFLDISLSVDHHRLEFLVRNSTESNRAKSGVKENIGLPNLRRQLQILYKESQLSVQQGDSEFTAMLHINLESHV